MEAKIRIVKFKIRFCGTDSMRKLYDELAGHNVCAPDYDEFFAPLDTETAHPIGRRPNNCLPIYEDREIFTAQFDAPVDEIQATALLNASRNDPRLVSANVKEALACALDDMFWPYAIGGGFLTIVLKGRRINELPGFDSRAKPSLLTFRAGTRGERMLKFCAYDSDFPPGTKFLAKRES